MTTVHRIRSQSLRAKGAKFETTFKSSAERKLAELHKAGDTSAKIITLVIR